MVQSVMQVLGVVDITGHTPTIECICGAGLLNAL